MRPLVFGIKRFVNYILASNGRISDDEAELLGEVLDRKIAPQELADYITAENVYSREYAQAIPASGSGSARKSFSRITPRRNCAPCPPKSAGKWGCGPWILGRKRRPLSTRPRQPRRWR